MVVKGTLTTREREVLQCIAEGLRSPELEAKLHITKYTLRTHMDHILIKLEAVNRPHAVYIAMTEGFIG